MPTQPALNPASHSLLGLILLSFSREVPLSSQFSGKGEWKPPSHPDRPTKAISLFLGPWCPHCTAATALLSLSAKDPSRNCCVFLGNGRADVAAKADLPPPSPHIAKWILWRQHADHFRFFGGAFGPTLARRIRQEPVPTQPRVDSPPGIRARGPKSYWHSCCPLQTVLAMISDFRLLFAPDVLKESLG